MCPQPTNRRGDRPGYPSFSEPQIEQLLEVISRSQQNYRELIDNLDQAVFTLSADGEVRVANRALLEILGITFQDLIGHRLSEFLESPTPDEARRAFPSFAKEGTWTGVVPVRLKRDGSLRYFSCWFHALEEGGRITAVIGWARDITAHLESAVRFTDFVHSLHEGIFFSTPEGQILDANPALVQMLGYSSKEELQAHNVRELYDPPSQRDVLVRETVEKGWVRDLQVTYRRKDGKRIHCLASVSTVRDSHGRLRFQGMVVDITELHEIKQKLQAERKFVRPLMESFPNVIATLDREGRFDFVSERVKEVLGLEPRDLIGQHVGLRTHPEDRARLAASLQSVLAGRQRYLEIEYRELHADGAWRTLLGSVGPLFDEEGKITGIVSTARDVTESKLMEQQLARSEKLAAMGQMLAGAAHELNNPLTAILGIADLLRERAADDAMRRHADIVLQQARRAAAIVQDLLAFSRPQLQQRTALRMDDVVRQVVELQRAALGRKNIRVNFNAPGDLPMVDGDPKLLAQVFQSIVVNAEQSISATRDHGAVDVSCALLNGHVRVTILDDGPGIAPENLGKIFDPFFTTKRPGGGTGLGLTICMAVIKDHGGKIEVESSPHGGAAFHVFLPVASGMPAAAAQAAPATVAASNSGGLHGQTVLIVDDEDSILEIVQEGLSARGVKVHTAATPEAAMAHLANTSFDIVVCDFNLPGLSGEQLFESLRAQLGSSLPRFVFMTGELVDGAVSARLREKGASVLQKPFHVSALAALCAAARQPEPSTAN